MTKLILDKSDLYISFLNSFVDSGWKGKWDINNSSIIVSNIKNITLEEYINTNGYLNYYMALRLALCLGQQIALLQQFNKAILSLSLSDIIVFNHDWFFLKNINELYDLDENSYIYLTTPIKPNVFSSPEIKNITNLPINLYFSSIYYTLALLCIYSLNITDDLLPINSSKLYFLLKRCLDPNPNDRIFILI